MKNRARSKGSQHYQASARDTELGFPFRAPKQSLIWRLSASLGYTGGFHEELDEEATT
jgi:hypothetical protein